MRVPESEARGVQRSRLRPKRTTGRRPPNRPTWPRGTDRPTRPGRRRSRLTRARWRREGIRSGYRATEARRGDPENTR